MRLKLPPSDGVWYSSESSDLREDWGGWQLNRNPPLSRDKKSPPFYPSSRREINRGSRRIRRKAIVFNSTINLLLLKSTYPEVRLSHPSQSSVCWRGKAVLVSKKIPPKTLPEVKIATDARIFNLLHWACRVSLNTRIALVELKFTEVKCSLLVFHS